MKEENKNPLKLRDLGDIEVLTNIIKVLENKDVSIECLQNQGKLGLQKLVDYIYDVNEVFFENTEEASLDEAINYATIGVNLVPTVIKNFEDMIKERNEALELIKALNKVVDSINDLNKANNVLSSLLNKEKENK